MEFVMSSQKLAGGSLRREVCVLKVGGGEMMVGNSKGWGMLVVYRGKHCPICKSYLGTLDKLLDQFKAAGTEVFAVSADTKEKAETEAAEEAWRFPVGYGLSQEHMPALGLYISEPRSPQETDRPLPDPRQFWIN